MVTLGIFLRSSSNPIFPCDQRTTRKFVITQVLYYENSSTQIDSKPILKMRLAKWEITIEAYVHLVSLLSNLAMLSNLSKPGLSYLVLLFSTSIVSSLSTKP